MVHLLKRFPWELAKVCAWMDSVAGDWRRKHPNTARTEPWRSKSHIFQALHVA